MYFRKPLDSSTKKPLKTTEVETLLNSAAEGKPVLYEAFAKFLLEELDHEDIVELLPQGGKGSNVEQLMEVIAEKDPRRLLEECFGRSGIRKISRKLSQDLQDNLSMSPINLILSSFGFPSHLSNDIDGAEIDGPEQVRKNLYKRAKEISSATNADDIKSSFKEGCYMIERLLKEAIWGWMQFLFGCERDSHLLTIIHQKDPKKQLDRLSFGDIIDIFRKLPGYIKESEQGCIIERKFARKDIYLPKKFSKELEKIVEFRNKVEHRKYSEEVPLSQQKEELSDILKNAYKLIQDLVESQAIPRIAEPYKEIRDKWSRITYQLELDDGTSIEARFSTPLVFGKIYLYFGTGTNPRPVDPLILPREELGKVP